VEIDPTIERGTWIPPERVEEMVGARYGTARYGFAVINLIKQLYQRTVAMGEPKIAKQERRGIAILTDDDATEHLIGVIDRGSQTRETGLALLISLSEKRLSPERRKLRVEAIELNSRILVAEQIERRAFAAARGAPPKKLAPKDL